MKDNLLMKIISVILITAMMVPVICSCSSKKNGAQIPFRFASAEEGKELMSSNTEYYDQCSENDIEFRLRKSGGTTDELIEASTVEVRDFTRFEKRYISDRINDMEKFLDKNGYVLPQIDEIVFIKTDMTVEGSASGYTHGTQIYLGSATLGVNALLFFMPDCTANIENLLWHELFHCLTRCNPEFRAQMYSLIHFTVTDHDFEIPPSVMEYYISNPDVEHHDSYATFIIDGQETDCFTVFITTKHYDEVQSDFFSCNTTALVPIDGSDIYYTPDQASNFDEVFGTNNTYVVDPEECMATNFADAMTYGMDGRDGNGYPNPEIIEGILDIMSGN